MLTWTNPDRNYSYADWIRKLSALGWVCYWCEKPLTETTAHRDHLQPISRGGKDVISNIVPACLPCNSKKGNKNEEEFRAYLSRNCGKQSTGASSYKEKEISKESEPGSWAWKNPAINNG